MESKGPLIDFFGTTFWSMLASTGNGDVFDTQWYNNADAAGAQLYPYGLYKYFDMNSIVGYFDYIFSYIWVSICEYFKFLTLWIPADIWLNLFLGAKLEGFEKWLLWYFCWLPFCPNKYVGMFFHVTVEDGWGMLSN